MALLLTDTSQICATAMLLLLLVKLKWDILQSYNVRTKLRQNRLDGWKVEMAGGLRRGTYTERWSGVHASYLLGEKLGRWGQWLLAMREELDKPQAKRER